MGEAYPFRPVRHRGIAHPRWGSLSLGCGHPSRVLNAGRRFRNADLLGAGLACGCPANPLAPRCVARRGARQEVPGGLEVKADAAERSAGPVGPPHGGPTRLPVAALPERGLRVLMFPRAPCGRTARPKLPPTLFGHSQSLARTCFSAGRAAPWRAERLVPHLSAQQLPMLQVGRNAACRVREPQTSVWRFG